MTMPFRQDGHAYLDCKFPEGGALKVKLGFSGCARVASSGAEPWGGLLLAPLDGDRQGGMRGERNLGGVIPAHRLREEAEPRHQGE
jgi:hypothetical protein